MEDRRYQQRSVEAFKSWWSSSQPLSTLILPTGTGKSYTMSLCCATLPEEKRILWVAHREELIQQGVDTLKSVKDFNISVEMADLHGSPDSQIIVGTVQTVSKARHHIKDWQPDLVIIDEYHHFAETNVQYKGLQQRFPNAKFLGATATPYRMSGEELPLGNVLMEMDIGAAIRHGYLVQPSVRVLKTKTSLADVKVRAGDFATKELSTAVNNKKRNELIRDNVIELIKEGRKGVIFAVDVAHSHELYELLKDHVRAAEIYGTTPKEERREIIAKIAAGEIDVVTNNMCLTEGWDAPHLSFCCMARPTRSLGLYTQCIGRVLRLWKDKSDAVILDLHDKVKVKQSRITYFDFAASGDLSGEGRKNDKILEADVDLSPARYIKNLPIFLRNPEQHRWMVDEEAFHFSSWMIQKGQWITTWSCRTPSGMKERLFFICHSGKKDSARVLGFDRIGTELLMQSDDVGTKKACERIVLDRIQGDEVYPLIKSGAPWKQNPASQKQSEFVESLVTSGKIGYDVDVKGLTKGEASSIIEQAKWQTIILERFGCSVKEQLLTYDLKDEEI